MALHDILRRYSCLAPLRSFSLPQDVPRQILQDFLVKNVLNNELLAKYPPSVDYQRSFWKNVVSHLETDYDKASEQSLVRSPYNLTISQDGDFELSSDIYERYLELLQLR